MQASFWTKCLATEDGKFQKNWWTCLFCIGEGGWRVYIDTHLTPAQTKSSSQGPMTSRVVALSAWDSWTGLLVVLLSGTTTFGRCQDTATNAAGCHWSESQRMRSLPSHTHPCPLCQCRFASSRRQRLRTWKTHAQPNPRSKSYSFWLPKWSPAGHQGKKKSAQTKQKKSLAKSVVTSRSSRQKKLPKLYKKSLANNMACMRLKLC